MIQLFWLLEVRDIKLLSKNGVGVLLAVAGGLCWGGSGACGQYLFSNYPVDSNWLVCIRLLLAGGVMLLFSIPKQHKNLIAVWKNKKDMLSMLIFSIFGISLCQLAYLKTVFYTNAATATILQYTSVIFILAYSCISFKRKPTLIEICSVVLTLLGTFLLATHGKVSNMAISTVGLVWGIVASFSAAAYNLIPTKIIPRYSNSVITGYGMLIGGIFLSVVFRVWDVNVPHFDFKGLLALFAIIFVGTILAFSLYMKSITYIGAVKASMLASTEPIAAVLLSVFWLKTEFEIIDYLGFAVIIIAVLMLSRGKNKNEI